MMAFMSAVLAVGFFFGIIFLLVVLPSLNFRKTACLKCGSKMTTVLATFDYGYDEYHFRCWRCFHSSDMRKGWPKMPAEE